MRKGNPSLKFPLIKFSRVNVLFVWFIVFLAMTIYAIGWFTCGIFVMKFIDAIISTYSFDSPWDTTVTAVRLFFLYHPIIAIIGWIVYGILNSIKRDVDRWRVPY